MITKSIAYEVEGTNLTGYLADDASRGPGRPGVLVVHQGRGLADHTRDRARMLAELGYVSFALDMFGETPSDMQHAMKLLEEMAENPALLAGPDAVSPWEENPDWVRERWERTPVRQ